MLPFTLEGEPPFGNGDWVFLPGIAGKVREGAPLLEAWVIAGGQARPFTLRAPELGPRERELILAGCLINVNRNRIEKAGDSYRN
jgi:aconitate hydratase